MRRCSNKRRRRGQARHEHHIDLNSGIPIDDSKDGARSSHTLPRTASVLLDWDKTLDDWPSVASSPSHTPQTASSAARNGCKKSRFPRVPNAECRFESSPAIRYKNEEGKFLLAAVLANSRYSTFRHMPERKTYHMRNDSLYGIRCTPCQGICEHDPSRCPTGPETRLTPSTGCRFFEPVTVENGRQNVFASPAT